MGARALRQPRGRARLLGAERLPQPRRPLEGAALLERLAARLRRIVWQTATIEEIRPETPRATTLVLDLPDWPGHLPGQHVDVRLTAEDGYQAQRSYSIASAPGDALELTVERIDDGEVSPWLTEVAQAGDQFEVRGPIGGHFAWHAEHRAPLLLVGGGSGLVPLMAMLRHHRAIGSDVEARLLVSARSLDDLLFGEELAEIAGGPVSVEVTLTREAPPGWQGGTRRVDGEMLTAVAPEPGRGPLAYVCGPTPFVEHVAFLLVELGHLPARVRTERFGPTG